MQGYTPTLVLSGLYLVAVYIGPKLMKDREPFKFKYTLFIYNFILIIMNFHICSEVSGVYLSFLLFKHHTVYGVDRI